jgi:beta-lactamase class A
MLPFLLRRLSLAATLLALSTPLVHASEPLQAQLDQLAKGAEPARLGIAVVDLASGARYGVHLDQPYPMMSDFKAAVAAAALSRVDAGSMTLDQRIVVRPEDFLDGSAVPSLGSRLHGKPISVTLAELLHDTVTESDNTGVEVLLAQLGGAGAVQDFLDRHQVTGVRITAGEREIAAIFHNLNGATEPPANESDEQRAVRLTEGYHKFLSSPPNTTTPAGGALFIGKLYRGELLSPRSTRYLLHLMHHQAERLVGGVPAGAHFSDKTGTSVTVNDSIAAFNDMGVISWRDGKAIVVVAYLSDSGAREDERARLFASIARDASTALHH